MVWPRLSVLGDDARDLVLGERFRDEGLLGKEAKHFRVCEDGVLHDLADGVAEERGFDGPQAGDVRHDGRWLPKEAAEVLAVREVDRDLAADA